MGIPPSSQLVIQDDNSLQTACRIHQTTISFTHKKRGEKEQYKRNRRNDIDESIKGPHEGIGILRK